MSATTPASTGTQWHVTPLGGFRKEGRWQVRPRTVVVTLIGGAALDLREASLDVPVTTVTKVSLVGGVSVRVPTGVRVEVSGFNLIGRRRVELPEEPPADAPTLRIAAYGLVGGVRVTG